MKKIISATIVAAGLGFGGCGAADDLGLNGDCVVLAMGGNKLCGEEAKAWCRATDDLRAGDPTLGIEADTESQAICDGL
jgi:hypothetical protein